MIHKRNFQNKNKVSIGFSLFGDPARAAIHRNIFYMCVYGTYTKMFLSIILTFSQHVHFHCVVYYYYYTILYRYYSKNKQELENRSGSCTIILCARAIFFPPFDYKFSTVPLKRRKKKQFHGFRPTHHSRTHYIYDTTTNIPKLLYTSLC